MVIRKVTTSEIAAVGDILVDKQAIQLLKEIKNNVITEEDTKGKRKGNEVFNFVGFTHGDDIFGEDPDQEDNEYLQKKGAIKRLVDAGLILEGFHIPLERKSEKKFGDTKVANVDEKISKYKLTEEGYAVLAVVEQGDNNNNSSVQQQYQPKQQQSQQQSSTKSKEIAAFKAEREKELRS